MNLHPLVKEIQTKLEGIDLPRYKIHCFGRQIHVDAIGYDTISKWVDVVSKFATVKTVTECLNETVHSKETAVNAVDKDYFKVYRLWATLE